MVDINLFEKPHISINGRPVAISLKKSEAVLFYLAYQKRVTRMELVNLIWEGVDTQTAKKNLRNCLYRLKKDLGVDIFNCPNKNVITLNEEMTNVIGEEDAHFLSTYQGLFISEELLKDAPTFDQWIERTTLHLNQKYNNLVFKVIPELIQEKAYDQALEYALTMRQIDEFDEKTARWLMTIYHAMGQFKPLVEEYNRIKTLLEEEMGIGPDKETRSLYYELINQRLEGEGPESALFGREKEITSLMHFINPYENHYKMAVVKGEAGIGKTSLVEEVISQSPFILRANCYQMESHFNYKPWDDIFNQMTRETIEKIPENARQILARVFPSLLDESHDLKVEHIEALKEDYLEKVVCKLLRQMDHVVIFFDDIQWMDAMSLKLLTTILLHTDHVKVIGTLRNEYSNPVDQMIKVTQKYKLLKVVKLERFDRQGTFDFINFLSDESTQMIEEAVKEKIFMESEGNAFFVVEYMNYLSSSAEQRLEHFKDLLGARFLGLSEEALKVLNIAAMFFDEMDYSMLVALYTKDDSLVIDALQELKEKFILKEWEIEGELKYRFTHNKLREYIYEQVPKAKIRILHQKIATILEDQLTGYQKDVIIYQKLIYHFKQAGNYHKHLDYYLSYLKYYYDFSHELYPEINQASYVKLEARPDSSFKEIGLLIEKGKESGSDIDYLEMEYLHMYGRYLIRQGLYEIGNKKIDSLIALAQKHNHQDMIFKGCVQRIYHAIQVDDASMLKDYLEVIETLKLSDKQSAIADRLRGIYWMMAEQFNEARTCFESSIDRFEKMTHSEKYLLNIAASYNYISETYRRQGAYDKAMSYVDRAIRICETHNIIRGGSIFNTNAGIIAYLKEDDMSAEAYFNKALLFYESIDTLWRRGEAEGYLAMVYAHKGQTKKADQMIKLAIEHAKVINHPQTLKLLNQFEQDINA